MPNQPHPTAWLARPAARVATTTALRRAARLESLELRRLLSGEGWWTLDELDTAPDVPRDPDGTVADTLVHEIDSRTGEERVVDYSVFGDGEGGGDLDGLDGFLRSEGFDGLEELLGSLGDPKDFVDGIGDALDSTESVYGSDDRVRITPTTSFPWRSIGRLNTGCSGAMIGPNHFLTAGHCVHGGGAGGSWFGGNGDFRVSMAQDGSTKPYGEAKSTYVRSYTGWTQGGNWEWDWALITLDRNIGGHTGWMGREWNSNDSHYNGTTVNTAGYPGDKPGGTMWYSSGPVASGNSTHLFYNGTLDTAGGQSGSPVWRFDGADRFIVGVHAYGDGGNGFNEAVRMTQGKFNDLDSWMSTDASARPATDRPDLLDYDEWFGGSTSTLGPGSVQQGGGVNAGFRLHNLGTAASGTVPVRFYASTNSIISGADTLLGTVNVPSVSPFDYRTVSFNGTIPATLATGSYYVGWIIDPTNVIAEYEEGNNVGYHGSTINVTAAPQADYYENNDTLATATNFETLADRTNLGLSIDAADDDDYYRFTAGANGTLDVDVLFSHALGDVNVRLLDSSGTTLASSLSSSNNESITHSVTRGTTYYLRVYGWAGATNPNYTLTLDGPAVPADGLEPNDSFAAARNLGTVTNYSRNDLTVHAAGNDDYYRFTAAQTGTLTASIDFRHADGDLDMVLLDAAGAQVAGAGSTTDDESLSAGVVAGQAYVLRVYGFGGDLHWDYDLAIAGPTDTTPPAVVSSSFAYETEQRVDVRFSEPVGPSVAASDLTVRNLTTGQTVPAGNVAVTYVASSDTARFRFVGLPGNTLADGNYRATLPAGSVRDAAGNAMANDATLDFFVLAGDFNRDRSVNLGDFTTLSNNFGQGGRTYSQGDANYDGQVNLADFTILSNRFGRSLPAPDGDGGGGGGSLFGDDGDDE